MRTVKATNLLGYPFLTKEIQEFAVVNKLKLVVGAETLPNSPVDTMLIESPAVLESWDIPIPGYQKMQARWVKCPLSMVPGLTGKLKVHVKDKRLPPKILVAYLKAPVKQEFLASLAEGSDNHRAARLMVSRFLPPSLKDKFTPPAANKAKDKAKTKVTSY